MTEQRRPITTSRKKLAVFAILVTVGVGLWLFWPREAQVVRTIPACPSKPLAFAPTPTPTPPKRSYLTVTHEGITFIDFDATAEAAGDVQEFGNLFQVGRGKYILYVDDLRYNFQEVLAYLKSWDECREATKFYTGVIIASPATPTMVIEPTPTPTLEPGGMLITDDGPVRYGGNVDGRCYVDALSTDLIYTGREVSCDDLESTVTPTPTPALMFDSPLMNAEPAIPRIYVDEEGCYWIWGSELCPETPTTTPGEPIEYTVVGGGRCYVEVPECTHDSGEGWQWIGPCPVEWGRKVSCDDLETAVEPTPTPTPSYDIYDLLWGNSERTSEYVFTPVFDAPEFDALVLRIDWLSSILITDAFSQTTIVKGPATVRFSRAWTAPTLTPTATPVPDKASYPYQPDCFWEKRCPMCEAQYLCWTIGGGEAGMKLYVPPLLTPTPTATPD